MIHHCPRSTLPAWPAATRDRPGPADRSAARSGTAALRRCSSPRRAAVGRTIHALMSGGVAGTAGGQPARVASVARCSPRSSRRTGRSRRVAHRVWPALDRRRGGRRVRSSGRLLGPGPFGGGHLRRQVHVSRGGLDMGVAHQVAQHQQVDPGGSKLGPEGVTKPMRANTARPGPGSMDTEHLAQARRQPRELHRRMLGRGHCRAGPPPWGDGSPRQCRRVGAISPTLG